MKKLLLLGGSRYLLPVIKTAHEMGCYVITCDYLPDNIAHKYSDDYCNVSIIDKEAVLEMAAHLQIDGIMSFACLPVALTNLCEFYKIKGNSGIFCGNMDLMFQWQKVIRIFIMRQRIGRSFGGL